MPSDFRSNRCYSAFILLPLGKTKLLSTSATGINRLKKAIGTDFWYFLSRLAVKSPLNIEKNP